MTSQSADAAKLARTSRCLLRPVPSSHRLKCEPALRSEGRFNVQFRSLKKAWQTIAPNLLLVRSYDILSCFLPSVFLSIKFRANAIPIEFSLLLPMAPELHQYPGCGQVLERQHDAFQNNGTFQLELILSLKANFYWWKPVIHDWLWRIDHPHSRLWLVASFPWSWQKVVLGTGRKGELCTP